MNTFFNIAQELSLSICFRRRSAGMGMEAFNERHKTLNSISRIPLQRRISQRGNQEQYNQKFVSNYYGSKRLSRSHVFTATTV